MDLSMKPKLYNGSGWFELRKDGRLYRKGDYTDCIAALIRFRPQGEPTNWASWAMKHGGWTIQPPFLLGA